jgi:hypothetical protein
MDARLTNRRGAALVITTITISVLAILIIGFLSAMLTERKAAGSYEDTQRAKLIAQGAVSHAIDLLRTNIPEPARISQGPLNAPGKNWFVNPGRLTVVEPGKQPRYVPLHTGEVTRKSPPELPRDAESVDLNQPLPGETMPAIAFAPSDAENSEPPPMRIRWVPLLRDPSRPADATNPLVGRYAFWMDDECARLNFNTALGKPAPDEEPKFGDQLRAGFTTPLFTRGNSAVNHDKSGTREWALGKPQSVNLDILLPSPEQLQHDKLLAQTFLHGFARYPEAIMNFVDLPSPREWFDREKFNLTFYNRSPEFNAFGRSRFFTTFVPLSLEAGPSYQHPFVHDPTGRYDGNPGQVLNLNSLLGSFGFTTTVTESDGDEVLGGNAVNRAQLDMLLGYFHAAGPASSEVFLTSTVNWIAPKSR